MIPDIPRMKRVADATEKIVEEKLKYVRMYIAVNATFSKQLRRTDCKHAFVRMNLLWMLLMCANGLKSPPGEGRDHFYQSLTAAVQGN